MSKTISLGEKLIKLCSKQVFAWRKGQISSLPLALTGLAYLEWWRRRSVHSSMSLLSRSKATSTSHSSLMASMMVVISCLCLCHWWVGGQGGGDGGWLWAPVSAILRLFHLKSTQFNSHLTRTVDRLSLPGRAYTCTSLIQSSCHSSDPESSPADSSQEQSFSYIMSEIRIPIFKSFSTFDHCDC